MNSGHADYETALRRAVYSYYNVLADIQKSKMKSVMKNVWLSDFLSVHFAGGVYSCDYYGKPIGVDQLVLMETYCVSCSRLEVGLRMKVHSVALSFRGLI